MSEARAKELEEYDAIIHTEVANGSASSIHIFEAGNPFGNGSS